MSCLSPATTWNAVVHEENAADQCAHDDDPEWEQGLHDEPGPDGGSPRAAIGWRQTSF